MKTWRELRGHAGRNDLPRILAEGVAMSTLDRSDLPKAIEETWTSCEWPLQAADADVWLYLYGLAIGMDEFIKDGEVCPNTELPETTKLYRGCVEQYREGLSWTTDRKQAEWFATRLESAVGEGHLYTTEAPREAIMGVFHARRGESEYVVDVTYLDIEEIEFRKKIS